MYAVSMTIRPIVLANRDRRPRICDVRSRRRLNVHDGWGLPRFRLKGAKSPERAMSGTPASVGAALR